MAENRVYIVHSDEKGSVNISEDVISVTAAVAAAEVEGVYGPFVTHNKEITSVLGRKGLSKGVKLTINDDIVTIDVSIIAEVGYSVSEVGAEVQKAVISAVQDTVGISVSAVNVSIHGIALKKKP